MKKTVVKRGKSINYRPKVTSSLPLHTPRGISVTSKGATVVPPKRQQYCHLRGISSAY